MGVSHIAKAKDVDVIKKGQLAREQMEMRKEHLENPALKRAEETAPGGGGKEALKSGATQCTYGGSGGVWSTGLTGPRWPEVH